MTIMSFEKKMFAKILLKTLPNQHTCLPFFQYKKQYVSNSIGNFENLNVM